MQVYGIGRKLCMTKWEDQEAVNKEFIECLKVLEEKAWRISLFLERDHGICGCEP